jgi:hypothetical protein
MTVNTFRTRCYALDGVREMSVVELLGKRDGQIVVHGHPRSVAQWHLATACSPAIRNVAALGIQPLGGSVFVT